MILSDRDLLREISGPRGLKIDPINYKDIGPASVDVYLGDTMCHQDGSQFCMGVQGYYLEPLEFVLASTVEVVSLPDDIMGQVHGCSSIGRTGLFVQNAGLIDPGFTGQITLELFNASAHPISLRTGQRIAQLSFAYLISPARHPYQGRYQDQRGATAARPPRSTP